jgi:hypothetical protein
MFPYEIQRKEKRKKQQQQQQLTLASVREVPKTETIPVLVISAASCIASARAFSRNNYTQHPNKSIIYSHFD